MAFKALLFITLVASVQAIPRLETASCLYGTESICGTFDLFGCEATATCFYWLKSVADDAGLCCSYVGVDERPAEKAGTCPAVKSDDSDDSDECDDVTDECQTDFDCNGQLKCCKTSCNVNACATIYKGCTYDGVDYASGDNFASTNYKCDDCYCKDGVVNCTGRLCVMEA